MVEGVIKEKCAKTDASSFKNKNANGTDLTEFCVNRDMCVSNIIFSHKCILSCKRVGVGRDGLKFKGYLINC